MATIKSYTDLHQSKKLMEFLPPESADMHYARIRDDLEAFEWTPLLSPIPKVCATYVENIPCWSLAALLSVLPISLNILRDGKWNAMVQYDGEAIYEVKDNPVNACVAIIEKLHKLKIL